MKTFQNLFKAFAMCLPAILLIFLLSTGCETEKEIIKTETVTVHDTVIVTITVHDTLIVITTIHDTIVVTIHDTTVVTINDTIVVNDTIYVGPFSIDTVLADPETIAQGGTVTLTASVPNFPGSGPVTYTWLVTEGTFIHQTETGDTVHWKAPDFPTIVQITVYVSDGNLVGLGKRTLGVGLYVPTEPSYYLGDMACSGCHAGKHGEWAETGHAHAWETLQNIGHPQPFCNPCHTVGYEPAPNTGNSGYDEAPIAKFENVQCENCHGPASEHVANVDPTLITLSYDMENCGKCHDGTHHPYKTEWLQSPHNFDATSSHGAPTNSFCQGCHEGVAASIRLAGESAANPLNQFYGSGAIAERPDTTEVGIKGHVCQTCHDPHSDEFPGQVRTTADVPLVEANGENPIITEGGTGKLCMHCHHARRGPDAQIANGYAHFGPHANPQADMIKGKSAYHGVADPSFPWTGPSHLLVQNSCKTCHLNMIEYGGPNNPAVTGHTFLPTVEACTNCHGYLSDFDDIPAREDFDGNGIIEGVQSEVEGLIELLENALIASGLDTNGVGFVGALGDTTISTFQQREAGYNLIFLQEDRSMGIHNPDYAVQLLQQSILHIEGTLPNAKIVRKDGEVVAGW
jgi:hypothetical protein